MLLGYSFEPRPKSRVLSTAGLVMTIGLSTVARTRKKQFDEIEQDFKTSPENWAAATSKV